MRANLELRAAGPGGGVFKHILLPTDGSLISEKATRAAVAFAREIGARITGYYAVQRASPGVIGEGYAFPNAGTLAAHRQREREDGAKYIGTLQRAAREAGVPFDALVDEPESPAEGIAAAARERNCDVIFMGTHARTGVARLAEGSVTSEVLARARVPVLVYR